MESAEPKGTTMPDLTGVSLVLLEETSPALAESLRLLIERLDLQEDTLYSFNASLG
ncbi:hypothetical protein ACQEU3_37370 [Spirillospora sp. CA-253888]